MIKKSKYLFITFFVLLASLLGLVSYLDKSKSMSFAVLEKKRAFVALTGLPDLALSSGTYYIRHRTLSNIADVYTQDASLREYSKASFSQNTFYKER